MLRLRPLCLRPLRFRPLRPPLQPGERLSAPRPHLHQKRVGANIQTDAKCGDTFVSAPDSL